VPSRETEEEEKRKRKKPMESEGEKEEEERVDEHYTKWTYPKMKRMGKNDADFWADSELPLGLDGL
jgi:hypothetical protein